MSIGLTLLSARRVTRPVVAAVVMVAAALPLLDPAETRLEGLPAALQVTETGAASTGWIAALLVATAWAATSGARLVQRWYDGESAWLAPTRPTRLALAAAGVLGISLGSAALALPPMVPFAILPAEGADPLLERELAAGPQRSVVLAPGDTSGIALPPVSVVAAHRLRVRLMPTVGGLGATTDARLTVRDAEGDAASTDTVFVGGRRWAEFPLPPGGELLVVTNVGEGALAVLGPQPVEIWRPSDAFAGGHLRAAALAALWVAAIGALAAAAGAWVTPPIAGLLTIAAALLAATGATGGVPALSLLAAELGRGLDALGEGRAPSRPGAGALGTAVATIALASLTVAPALSRWHREGRR